LSAEIVIQIERQILLGALVAGDRLPIESAIADQFGVSRTVVRDAMQILAARGLIEVRQGQGTSVAANRGASLGAALVALLMRSDLTMGEVLDARAALETQLAPLVARNASKADKQLIGQTLEQYADAVCAREWSAAADRHLAFHLSLVKALNLPALEVILRPLSEIILISSAPPRPDAPELWDVDLHRLIADAVVAHDEEAIVTAMRRHFAATEAGDYAEFRREPFRAAPGARTAIDRLGLFAGS
jgi:DNA-binding FadR family transcriptional regulator